MGTFTANEVEKYGGQGGGGYFSLKNDKDVARVRFMYNNIDDVTGYAVHEVELDNRKRYVNCLRNYSDPIDKCPFCAAKKFQAAKLFIPLYNIDDDQVQVWERGKKFFSKITSICSRYPNLVSHTFEIERNGKAGDQTTTYEIYETGADNTTMEDLPEAPVILGKLVLDKSADDMQYYLDNGVFPAENSDDAPRRRESSSREPGRRTPATTSRRERF